MTALAAAFLCLSPVAVDGDTLRCEVVGLVRLEGIDAPEMPGHCRRGRVCVPGDPFASLASLDQMIRGKRVRCVPSGRDYYGRVLARCVAGWRDLSCEQVARGRAVLSYRPISCPRF